MTALPRPTDELRDEAAFDFRRIFEEYGRYVWRVLRRMGVREADVPDLAQDVFMILQRKLDRVESPSALRGFIYGIAVREASDHRRSARERRETFVPRLPDQVVEASQDGAVDRARAHALLHHALGQLDDDKRAVFVLYELEELEMREVAAAVHCPLQTAYSRLHAARRTVAAVFERAERGGR